MRTLALLLALVLAPQAALARVAAFPETALRGDREISALRVGANASQLAETRQETACFYDSTASAMTDDPINNRDPTGQLTVRLTAEDGIDVPQLRLLRGTLKRLVESGGGSLPVTQLLSILSFPPEVDERIRKARGDVVVTAQRKPAASPSPKSASARDVSTGGMTTLKGHFRNKGAEIAESIPGVPAGIELSIDVAGNITINLENKVIDLDKLVGISAEIPGPNISIDRITLGPDWLEFEF